MRADRLELRELVDADIDAAARLGWRAFGFPTTETPLPRHLPPGTVRYGAFLGGRLVGRAHDHVDRQWWGGREVESSGIAGVAVAAEARGGGVARGLIGTLLERARERGAAVSALFPSISTVYRALGWASVGRVDTFALPTTALPHGPVPDGLEVREGTAADLPACHQLYRGFAVANNGMLSRDTERFRLPDGVLPPRVDGLTLALAGAELVGYCTWARGTKWGKGAALTVPDLLAATPEAAVALVTSLRSWHPVVPTVWLRWLGGDVLADIVPLELGEVYRTQSWMHRPVDLAAAVTSRGWPVGARGRAVFGIEDKLAPWNTGTWSLDIGDGAGELKRTTDDTSLHLTVAGFASLYCGVSTVAALRMAGHVRGDHDDAAALDVLASSAPPRLLDTF
jgi:predicted acetyltransferase